MPIIRNTESGPAKPQFSVGVNVILVGSKKMTAAQQEKALAVEKVHILIVDADDPENILVDEEAPAREFSTGSVGYGLNVRNATFAK
ncbi:MAG: hypothetical protein JXR84_27100 [Anaerolineae bacterium]|nr:hypothetical protein [Anaerolineae bacterium]